MDTSGSYLLTARSIDLLRNVRLDDVLLGVILPDRRTVELFRAARTANLQELEFPGHAELTRSGAIPAREYVAFQSKFVSDASFASTGIRC